MKQQLLLISNSKAFGKGYLDHCEEEIRDFLGKTGEVLFVPYALKDHEGYAQVAEKKFKAMGYGFKSVHREKDPREAVRSASCVFVGGGNTFRLLDALYREGLVEAIRLAVANGTRYMGSSAGSNIAAPSIKTTNDMPIIEPPSFRALNLISFQINPHYIDPDPSSTHMGETREQRIREFLEENDTPVVGLRENSWLRVENGRVVLKGSTGAKVFFKGKKPYEAQKDAELELA